MERKTILICSVNHSDFTLDKEALKNKFHYVLKPDGSWIQYQDDKNPENSLIKIGCVKNNVGELFSARQNAGLKSLLNLLKARHEIRTEDVSFETQNDHLGNNCTDLLRRDFDVLKLWKNSDVAFVSDKVKLMPEKLFEIKGLLFAPLFWLLEILGFDYLNKNNLIEIRRKK